MPASISPALQVASAAQRGGRGHASRSAPGQLDLQMSDAERAEVADQLSRHYGEGRLDQREFSERLDRVMAATTYRDLSGVLEDLPQPAATSAAPAAARRGPRRRHRRGLIRVAFLVLLAIMAAAIVHAVTWTIAPALWIFALCAIAVLAGRIRAGRQ